MTDRTPQDWAAHFSQLKSRPGPDAGLKLTLPRFNPRPAGVIQPGSASEVVLKMLRDNPGRWFTHAEIVRATGRTQKGVDWALLYLKARSLISTTSDDGRNSRYLRYSVAKGKGSAAQ
jgi:hypothetical protein